MYIRFGSTDQLRHMTASSCVTVLVHEFIFTAPFHFLIPRSARYWRVSSLGFGGTFPFSMHAILMFSSGILSLFGDCDPLVGFLVKRQFSHSPDRMGSLFGSVPHYFSFLWDLLVLSSHHPTSLTSMVSGWINLALFWSCYFLWLYPFLLLSYLGLCSMWEVLSGRSACELWD